MFILSLFYYWLLVSASKERHQPNIYKKKKNLKMLVHLVQKRQFLWDLSLVELFYEIDVCVTVHH